MSDGFLFRFPVAESTLQSLAKIIGPEQNGCPFLNFRLVSEAGEDFVSLELTGAEGTKGIIKSLFNWN